MKREKILILKKGKGENVTGLKSVSKKAFVMSKTKGVYKTTPIELQKKINDYFQKCLDNPIKKHDIIRSGQNVGDSIYIEIPKPWLFTELVLEIGITKSLIDEWEAKALNIKNDETLNEIVRIITEAKQKCSNQIRSTALAGQYNALIAAKIERLGDETTVTTLNANMNVEMSEDEANEIRKKLKGTYGGASFSPLKIAE